MRTESVSPLVLSPGDHLLAHGMDLTVMSVKFYAEHPSGLPTVAAQCRINNPEHISENRQLFGGIIPLDGSGGWTVQGNRLATVTRVVGEG